MNELNQIATPETIGGSIFGIAGIWLLFKKFLVKNAVENTNLSASDAYAEVIDNLRTEVRRLSDVNKELATALNELQRENIRLNNEISHLNSTITEMSKHVNIIKLRTHDEPLVGDCDRRRS